MQTLTPTDSPLVAAAHQWKQAMCMASRCGPMHGPGRIHKLLADARIDASQGSPPLRRHLLVPVEAGS